MTMSAVTSASTVGSKKLPPNLYVEGGGALAAGDHLGALPHGVGDVRLDLLDRLHVDERPDHRTRFEPVGNLHRPGGLSGALGERVIDAVLRQNAVGAQAGSLGERVFVNRAILNNDQEILVGVFDESDVFQRIAVDQQQICKRAFFHHTKLAWIGIDETGKGHQFAIVCSGHLECFGWRVPADHLGEYRPLPAGNARIEQNVAAKSRLDLVLLRQLVGVIRSRKYDRCLLPGSRAQRRHIFIIEEWLQAPLDILFCQ